MLASCLTWLDSVSNGGIKRIGMSSRWDRDDSLGKKRKRENGKRKIERVQKYGILSPNVFFVTL